MPRKHTYEEVQKYVEENGGGDILLSTEYNNTHIKLEFLCPNGHNYFAEFASYKSGHRCPKCYGNAKYTSEEVRNDLLNYGYELLGEYKNSATPIEMKCPEGHIINMSYRSFHNQGSRCKYCVGSNIKYTIDDVRKYMSSIGYTLLSEEYIGADSKLKMICVNGHETEMTLHSLKTGQRCKYCSNNNIRNSYDSIKEYFNRYGYELISDTYVSNKQKLDVRCPLGHKISISYNNFTNGERCHECKCSKGEQEIAYFLSNAGVDYIIHKSFEDCRDKLPLPFDFYIPSINIAIEYDGIQHYEKTDFSHGNLTDIEQQDALILCQKHDEIKNKYCAENNIKLIRIPYWDFDNIEQILKDEQIIS